jgi:AcrR family transcriptional regulator
MPRGSEELTDKRKNEIISACGKLYRSKGFRGITIKDISIETTFSRPSIYNYFETKEEIFLALLEREYEAWTEDLCKIAASGEAITCDRFSRLVAKSLGKREVLLKISAMNLYEIEEHSRPERLVDFKRTFRSSAEAFTQCLEKCLPDCGKAKREEIRYAFFPFMYGIYPYTHPTEKQREAMKQAKLSYEVWSAEKLVYHFLKQLLK